MKTRLHLDIQKDNAAIDIPLNMFLCTKQHEQELLNLKVGSCPNNDKSA